VKCLHLGKELVDLHRHRLTLLVEGVEVVDFCHVSPVILGEHLESSTKHGECGGRTCEHGEEPSWESSGCFILPPGVGWSIEIDDDREVIRGIPLSVSSHPPLVHAFDPPGQVSIPITTGEFDSHLSPVLDVPIQWGREGLLCDWGCPGQGSCSPFGCSLLFKQEALHVVEVALPFHGEDQAVDKFAQELWVKTFVHLNNVLHGPRGQGPPLDLGDEGML
jgi:hypothetical protein